VHATIPTSLLNDTMLEMKLLFKINIKSNNIDESDPVYNVMKICEDEDMIKKY
ncbi:hypothetical protein PIB30_100932, partial [Stylosanthes scabra]|nr:hypothetical protein [Stylosanthes scabra]